jgi:hypothetical protein
LIKNSIGFPVSLLALSYDGHVILLPSIFQSSLQAHRTKNDNMAKKLLSTQLFQPQHFISKKDLLNLTFKITSCAYNRV